MDFRVGMLVKADPRAAGRFERIGIPRVERIGIGTDAENLFGAAAKRQLRLALCQCRAEVRERV